LQRQDVAITPDKVFGNCAGGALQLRREAKMQGEGNGFVFQ